MSTWRPTRRMRRLGWGKVVKGLAEALKVAEESLALFRQVGDKRAESYVLHTVSQVGGTQSILLL